MSGPVTILVVEDEESYVDALQIALAREGFRSRVARTGPEAVRMFDEEAPDLVLLDLMLPGMSGVDVCRHIRARSKVPVIMVTAKDSEVDTVVGLEVGADDYVTKPYGLRELMARISAVLRRTGDALERPAPVPAPEVFEVQDVRLDVGRHEVVVRGEPVALPRKEFELLEVLMASHGRVLSRDQLISDVWGAGYYGDTKTLDVHIRRLRAKIETDPGRPTRITTVRGVGYRFESGT